MNLIKGFIMSLGMFSIIPVPKKSWNEKHLALVIPGLTLVGIIIGFIWYGLALALSYLSLPLLIQAAVLLFAPFFLSGFLHADGFMDTADAVFSRKSPEEKKRILKDTAAGAFAVTAIIMLVLFQFCAVLTILDSQKPLLIFIFIPAVSRCITGIAMLNLKPVFETGYYAMFIKETKPRHTVFICFFAVLVLFAAWYILGISALPLLAGAVFGIITTVYLHKQFKGLSGDLCGCIITLSEFAALLCMALI